MSDNWTEETTALASKIIGDATMETTENERVLAHAWRMMQMMDEQWACDADGAAASLLGDYPAATEAEKKMANAWLKVRGRTGEEWE